MANDEQQLELTEVVELTVVEGMMEAQIIKSKLESFEIPCMLKFEAVGRVMGITTDGLGQVQIMVLPEHFDRAREIIEIIKE
jgi:predicted Mrr-cat superfamily restriction endonuclease